MATVRMLTTLSGVDFTRHAGEEYSCDDAEAERLIAAGFAAAIAPIATPRPAKSERAVRLRKTETRA